MVSEVRRSLDQSMAWPGGRADVLYERFKTCIIDRQWPPGRHININRLAAEHNVSITPVREALARLSADRLVVSSPNKGYTVAPPPSASRLADLCTVRLLLEAHAARGAAGRITPRDLAALRSVHESIAALAEKPAGEVRFAFAALNRSFHQQIFKLNGNGVLCELYDQLQYHALIGHVYHTHGLTHLPEVVAEHGAILAALTASDPDLAEEAMRRHVEQGSRRLLGGYRSNGR